MKEEDTALTLGVSESVLASIPRITAAVECMEIERENFIEFGCYLYRASLAIMELQTTESIPENATEILQNLSKNVDLAKDLVKRCEEGIKPISNNELRGIMVQLEGLVRDMGECLGLIPSSSYGDQEYAEVALRSLSNEMQNAKFEISETLSNTYEPDTYGLSSQEQLKEQEVPTERDLYPISIDISANSSQFSYMTSMIEASKSTSSDISRAEGKRRRSSVTFPQMDQFVEPLYETFFCPLTQKIMDDPVTIATGVTYERMAIKEWFDKFKNSDEIICPTTRKKLLSRDLNTNIALKSTIEEWKERNELASIKVAKAALSLASSESMVLEAIKNLQSICQWKQANRLQVFIIGIVPLLVKFLEYRDKDVRLATLELLRLLGEDDDECKEIISRTVGFSSVIKLLSSSHQPVRHASLLFLLELSRSLSLCEKIGSVTGGILILISIKYKHNIDVFASEKADEILRNLERSPSNVKRMAECGFLEPLLNQLTTGNEETKMAMASYLGGIAVGHDNNTFVAERASPSLIKMVQSGSSLSRREAFKALARISSYQQNGNALVEAGVVRFMVEEIFTRRISDEPMNSIIEATAVLGNIFESGLDLENLRVNSHGHTVSSSYFAYNIICMLRNSNPDELNINLIRILLCLTKTPKSTTTIVSAVKTTEATFNLTEFINNPHEELGVVAVKLLCRLSPYIGHTLVERLCKTRGQPENLIQSPTEISQITERQAVSAKYLAQLPHQNLTLNLALLGKNVVPKILQTINHIQRSGTRSSRYACPFLEGLVGILVRFTATLYEPQILFLARNYNLTSVFTELLVKSSSDEVQRLSAIGLENLSSESINLSKPPKIQNTKFMKFSSSRKFLSFGSSKGRNIPACPVHRGTCSSKDTFCLVDAKAVERLLACLDHENAQVVEAALSAICTLLDDKVDVDKSVSMLSEVNAIKPVLKLVKEHQQEGLWQKSLWVIDKFLMKGGSNSASDISQDRLLPATLVSAFHHGDGNTRELAQKILRHLDKIPNFSTLNYST